MLNPKNSTSITCKFEKEVLHVRNIQNIQNKYIFLLKNQQNRFNIKSPSMLEVRS